MNRFNSLAVRRKLIASITIGTAALGLGAAWLVIPARGPGRKPAQEALAAFELPLLHHPGRKFSASSMRDTVWILNVWASWCAPCVTEHPVISDLAKRAPVVGVDYMDRREEAIAWLRRYGDPFRAALLDSDGQLGVKGVPATFVVDKKGVIRYQHSGPITQEIAARQILPLIAELERQ